MIWINLKYSCEIHHVHLERLGLPYSNQVSAANVYGTGQTEAVIGLYVSNYRNQVAPQTLLSQNHLSQQDYPNILGNNCSGINANGLPTGRNQRLRHFQQSSMERII